MLESTLDTLGYWALDSVFLPAMIDAIGFNATAVVLGAPALVMLGLGMVLRTSWPPFWGAGAAAVLGIAQGWHPVDALFALAAVLTVGLIADWALRGVREPAR